MNSMILLQLLKKHNEKVLLALKVSQKSVERGGRANAVERKICMSFTTPINKTNTRWANNNKIREAYLKKKVLVPVRDPEEDQRRVDDAQWQ